MKSQNQTTTIIIFCSTSLKVMMIISNKEYKIIKSINASQINQSFCKRYQNTDCSLVSPYSDYQTSFSKFHKLFKINRDWAFPPTRVKMRYKTLFLGCEMGLKTIKYKYVIPDFIQIPWYKIRANFLSFQREKNVLSIRNCQKISEKCGPSSNRP